MLTFACACGKNLKVSDEAAGKKVKCPGCGQVIVAPHLVAATVATPSLTSPPTSPDASATISGSDVASRSKAFDETISASSPATENVTFLAPPLTADEIGRLGSYRVLRVLGKGGMGMVLEAEDPQLKRRIALKVMLPQFASDAQAKQRFLREAQAAATLEHDHIISIYQVSEDRGVPYLAMPLLKGESLSARLKRDGRLPMEEAVRIGSEIADGLAAAHDASLIHRDIKPANIWLVASPGRQSGEARVKILDFGLARPVDADDAHLTGSGVILGTPAYMSPEQARGDKVDGRADLFSLGCVLYQMTTGQLPFKGKDTISALMSLAVDTPTDPRELNPDIPPELSALILQLLAKKPEDRPATAHEVQTRVGAIEVAASCQLAESGPQTAVLPVTEPSSKLAACSTTTVGQAASLPARRGPVAVVVLLLALCILIAATFGIIRIATPDGDFVIDTDDPDFAFSVSKDKVLLDDKKTKRQYHLKVLKQKSGEYELEVTDAGNDLTFHTKTFTIKRGQTVALKAWFERKQAAVVIPPPKVETPPTFTNSIGIEFVLVPKGKFFMGGGGGKVGDKEVDIPYDFYLGKYEVTQEEWVKVMKTNPSEFSRTGKERNKVADIDEKELKRFPVENVSWDDCQEFVTRLNELEKPKEWKYRLPTEAEWEYACRGGPTTNKLDYGFHYYFDRPTNTLMPDRANYPHKDSLGRTCKVGLYSPNRLGLYDMHGNVREWCEGAVPPDSKGMPLQVNRGGGCTGEAFACLASVSSMNAPSLKASNRGLRLARVPADRADISKPEPPAAAWKPVPFGQAPFDKLDAKEIPAEERFDYQPKELVAVIGSQANRRHWGAVEGIEITPDGKTVVSYGAGGYKVWDLSTRQVLRTIPLGNDGIHSSARPWMLSDHRILRVNRRVSDLNKPDELPKELFEDGDDWKEFVKTGRRVVGVNSADDGSTWLLATHSDYGFNLGLDTALAKPGDIGRRLAVVDGTALPPKIVQEIPHRGYAIEPRGRWLLYRDVEDRCHLAEVTRTGLKNDRVLKFPEANYAGQLRAVSSSGKLAAFYEPSPDKDPKKHALRIWDISGEEALVSSSMSNDPLGYSLRAPYHLRFSPHDQFLGGTADGSGLFVLLNVSKKDAKFVGGPWSNVRIHTGAYAFTPDSKQVITGDANGHVRFWDIASKKPQELEPAFDPASAFVWPANGTHMAQIANAQGQVVIARHDRKAQFWNLNGAKPQPLGGAGELWPGEGVGHLKGRTWYFFAGLITEQDGQWRRQREIAWEAGWIGLSADGELFIRTPVGDSSIVGWDLTKDPPVQAWQGKLDGFKATGNPVWIRISADKQLVALFGSLGEKNGIHLVDIRNGQPKLLTSIEQLNVYSLAFSPDGRHLAYGGVFVMKLANISGPEPKTVFTMNPGGTIQWVAFHPSGRLVAFCTDRGKIEIRSVPEGKVVREWTLPGHVGWVEFADDGRHLFTHNSNGTLYVLRLNDLAGK